MAVVDYTVANGRVIAEKRGGVRSYYLADGLGSTRALLDDTQTKTDTFTYWPYGEVQSRTGSTPTPFQFVGTLGYYRDSSSRTYVRARYYRQTLGRWQTADPLGPGIASYSYAGNSPTLRRDRYGLQEDMGEVVPTKPRTNPGLERIRANQAYRNRMAGIKGAFYLAMAKCLYDFGGAMLEYGGTADAYYDACKDCCKNVAAWAGGTAGSIIGGGLPGAVIGGLGGWVFGGLFCGDFCCQFFPEAEACRPDYDEGPPPKVLPANYEACCCECGGTGRAVRCPCDYLPYGCYYINPRPPCGPCPKELE